MGHERIGVLPRTKRWREVVEAIAEADKLGASGVAKIADRTLQNVQTRFAALHKDSGVQSAFAYLVALAMEGFQKSSGLSSPETHLRDNPSPLRIAKQLSDWVKQHADSREYAEVASRAGADTIVEWTKAQTKQGQLFDDATSATNIWTASANAASFCKVARSFFAHFTERYLRYFLEREASAQMSSLSAREDFNRQLHTHVHELSRHAFETSEITQSFAAGWYNNHAKTSRPSDQEVQGFLAIAFGKLHEELQRELPE